jgi:large subunit ribosomal protein L4
MKVSLYNQQGTTVGEVEVNDKLFAVAPDSHLLAEAVRIQQSNTRLGLSNTKTRGEVRGGGKKPWKQKGTGRARAGSTRSPIWRHGGVTFGPRANRNWELKMNKKAKVKALAMALTDKLQGKRLYVIDDITLPEYKTKLASAVFTDMAKNIEGFGKKHLLVVPSARKGIVRAVRNLQGCNSISASTLNIVEVLKADNLVILKDALQVLDKTFAKEMSAVKQA